MVGPRSAFYTQKSDLKLKIEQQKMEENENHMRGLIVVTQFFVFELQFFLYSWTELRIRTLEP